MTSFLRSDRSRAVAIWLLATAVLVFAMVIVGGATRLTDSGLSITEWKPISGALPPIGQAAWADEFARYQQIPQYHQLNPDMTVDSFKSIYWWEWSHRLLGRLVGLVFGLPLVVFVIRRQIPRRLIARCVAIFVLGGLQGVVGWWMVASGLSKRVSVAPERLMTHLGLALVLFILLIWTALDAWAGTPRQKARGGWPRIGLAFLAGVLAQSLLGALVAGNHAGLIYNDWPLFNGKLFPKDYFGDGFWATIAHSQAAVQLHHRLGAYILFVCAIVLAAVAVRTRSLAEDTRVLAVGLACGVLLQACLGIATLMMVAPLWLSILHQLGAALLLALATTFAWRTRRV